MNAIPKFLDRRKLIWTYTMLSTYRDICPHQASQKYVYKKIPWVETPQLKFGNDVHTAMEYRLGGKPLPAEMQQWEPLVAQFDGRGAVAEAKLAIDRQWKPCDYFDNGIAWGRCRADVVIKNETHAYLGDWKTGRVKEDPFELEVQAMFLKCKYPKLEKACGQFIWLKENRVGQMHDLSDFRRTAEEVTRIVALIERDKDADTFEKRPGGLCAKWCEVTTCEHNGRYDWRASGG